ncbi:MAG: metal ABC transporter substrate-binding protein [Caldilinea sp.]
MNRTIRPLLKVMGDRVTEFLGYRYTLAAMHQKLGFSKSHSFRQLVTAIVVVALMAGCAALPATPPATEDARHDEDHDHDEGHDHAVQMAALPALSSIALGEGEKLRVVATTNIVGDVVRQVGGDSIELVQLLPIGADPHSYQTRPDDLRQLNNAHVIFVNGLHLEEAMQPVLDNLDSGAPVIAVNAGVPTLEFGAEHDDDHSGDHDGSQEEEHHSAEEAGDGHHHEGVDPHTWMDVHNIEIWVDNVAAVLSALDPAHADLYAANADAYRTQLDELHEQIVAAVALIPPERRKLVTDHDNLAYLANAYGFTVAGTVIPSLSTLASPSAQDLAALQRQIEQEGIKAIFVGTTVNPNIAARIAGDTGAIVVPIYTGSLSDEQGPAATYIEMMRYNSEEIVRALAD